MARSEESPFSNFGGRVRNYLLEDEYANFDGSEYIDGSSSRQGDRNRLRKRNPLFKSRANVFQDDKPGSLFRALRRWKPFGKKEEQPGSNLMPEDEGIPTDAVLQEQFSQEPPTPSSELDPGHDLIISIVEGKGKPRIRTLLDELRNPNATPPHPVYGSVLAAAAGAGSVETIRHLVRAGADVDMQLMTGNYGSALCAAAASHHPENVKSLLRAGASVNMYLAQGEYGSPLAAAAREGSNKNVRLLIQAGADVNMRLKTGSHGSPLCAAVPSLHNIQALLDAGADVNMELYQGTYGSALAAASGSQFPKSLDAILEAGADVNMQLSFGEFGSALVAAAAAPDELTSAMNIKALSKAGANINMQVKDGAHGSALAAAASRSNPSPRVIETLIKAGANVNMKLHHGPYGSALATATSVKAVNALLGAGADVDMKLTHGSFGTALTAVLQRVINALPVGSTWDTEEEKVVQILLATGADVGPLHQFYIELLRIPDPMVRAGYGEAHEFKFDWELPLTLKSSSDIESYLSHKGTLTRNKNTVRLASCRDFLENSFGDIGTNILQGIVRALRAFDGFYFDGTIKLETHKSKICLWVTTETIEARDALEWICLTFRQTAEHKISVSTLSDDLNDGRPIPLNKLAPFTSSASSAECWYPLFDSAVIALQSSVEPQLQPCEGLELDFKQLLKLAAVEYPIMVNDGIVLMGYSTALIPIKQNTDGRIMWHLETATDDFQLQGSNLQATQKEWLRVSTLEDLLSAPAILGWCSEAEVLLGTDRLEPNVAWSGAKAKLTTWHWNGANLQLLAQTASPLNLGVQVNLRLDRSVNTIRFSPSRNYLKCLSSSSQQPIVLYDIKTKRAWLVSLISVLHHMLLAYCKTINKEFRDKFPPFAAPDTSGTASASLEVLRDNGALVVERSKVNEESEVNELTVRDLIMGFSVNLSKTTLQPPKASNMHPLTVSTIFGYEFADIVMDSPSSELKKSSLEKEGLAWISLLNNIKCLFCSDLGDAIIGKRSPRLSSPCNSLLEGCDLMAASIQSMELLAQKHGSNAHGFSCQLSNDHSWYLAGIPFQVCEHEEKDSCWDRPGFLEETLQEIKSRQVSVNGSVQNGNYSSLAQGALVFGSQARSKRKTFLTLVQSAETRKVSIQSTASLVS
ncbi:hypothetical protein N7467_002310 [Penicillium canescens]|nr:hypothetical protein N7467_002310 [Penicillium canescens]